MAFLDDVLVRVEDERREIHLGRALLTVLAAVLYGVGWLAAKTVAVLVLVLTWSFAAVKVGWTDARRTPGRRA